jgi:potassium voltage-gated channel Shab-related subfamily B protein 2
MMSENVLKFAFQKNETDDNMSINENLRITLNVGGFRHEVMIRILNKIPNSRLGELLRATTREELLSICDDYNLNDAEFYFDRDPTLFNYIINYYRMGDLHISDGLCPVILKHELIYWKINSPKMDICCEEKLYEKQKKLDEATSNYKMIENEVMIKIKDGAKINSTKLSRFQNRIWNMVDNSFEKNSTLQAKVIFK